MSINNIGPFTKSHLDMCIKNNSIDDALYEKYGVKRSLRDLNGIGINAGITNVSLSKSFTTDEKGNSGCDHEESDCRYYCKYDKEYTGSWFIR